jgi:hypothetical protein
MTAPAPGLPPNFPTSVPTGGSIDIWNLPKYITEYEKKTAKPFFTGTTTRNVQAGGAAPGLDYYGHKDPGSPGITSPVTTLQYSSAEEIMKQFAAMSMNDPSGFLTIQALLHQGGYLPGNPQAGFTAETQKAITSAMAQYIQLAHGASVPISFEEFLTHQATTNMAQNPPKPGGGVAPPTKPVIQLTDPQTLANYAQRAAQAALGHNLTKEDLQKFIDSFHEQESTAQQDAYTAAQQAAQGGNPAAVIDKNDPRASAITYATAGHEKEFGQHQIQGYTDAFLNMFLGGASAAPQMNVDPTAVSI